MVTQLLYLTCISYKESGHGQGPLEGKKDGFEGIMVNLASWCARKGVAELITDLRTCSQPMGYEQASQWTTAAAGAATICQEEHHFDE